MATIPRATFSADGYLELRFPYSARLVESHESEIPARCLAKRAHLDRGGDEAAMRALNLAYERLRAGML